MIREELTKYRQKTGRLAGRWWGIMGRARYNEITTWDTLDIPIRERWNILFRMENWHVEQDVKKGREPREYVPHNIDG